MGKEWNTNETNQNETISKRQQNGNKTMSQRHSAVHRHIVQRSFDENGTQTFLLTRTV